MDENIKSEVRISISEGKFEIIGSEEFVSKQVENFKDIIEKSLAKPIQKPTNSYPVKNATHKASDNKSSEEYTEGLSIEDKHPDVFAVDEENAIIVADIPGSSSASKTLNTALLYAYAQLKLGNEETNVEEIRKICESHGFLDSTNFSSHIRKGDPKLYLDKGKSKDRTIKLNRPGIKKSEELILEIEQNEQ